MKATFQDFLKENPTCGKYRDNEAAQTVFDLLSQDDSLLAMLDAAERGQPALTPCARQAEACMLQIDDPDFQVTENPVRQTVGCMVKTILRPFGYRVTRQRNLPKESGDYFRSASCYALLEPESATMRVVKRIEEI